MAASNPTFASTEELFPGPGRYSIVATLRCHENMIGSPDSTGHWRPRRDATPQWLGGVTSPAAVIEVRGGPKR